MRIKSRMSSILHFHLLKLTILSCNVMTAGRRCGVFESLRTPLSLASARKGNGNGCKSTVETV